jgi:hypothetical protein
MMCFKTHKTHQFFEKKMAPPHIYAVALDWVSLSRETQSDESDFISWHESGESIDSGNTKNGRGYIQLSITSHAFKPAKAALHTPKYATTATSKPNNSDMVWRIVILFYKETYATKKYQFCPFNFVTKSRSSKWLPQMRRT